MARLGRYSLLGLVLVAALLLTVQCDGASISRPVEIEGSARLYEGASCDTDDLEDSQIFQFTVEANQTVEQTIHLENRGFNGGDTADISLSISNQVQGANNQLVSASGSMEIMDHDTISPNDYKTVTIDEQAVVSIEQRNALLNTVSCVDDEVRVELRATVMIKPSPPAAAADPNRIVKAQGADCEANCRLTATQERCAASICVPGEFPLLQLVAVVPPEETVGEKITLIGLFGVQAENQSIALAEERDGVLYHRHRLQVTSWENDEINVLIHEGVSPGTYQMLIVYQITTEQGIMPIYIEGSTTRELTVTRKAAVSWWNVRLIFRNRISLPLRE